MACCRRRTHLTLNNSGELPLPVSATNTTSLLHGLCTWVAAPFKAAFNFLNTDRPEHTPSTCQKALTAFTTPLYMLFPPAVGIATSYLPDSDYSYSLMGAFVAAFMTLFVNIFNLHDNVTRTDYACLALKAITAASATVLAKLYLHHDTNFLAESAATSFFAAMLWQQFQHFRIRFFINKSGLTFSSKTLNGLTLYLSLIAAAWGTATYLLPASLIDDTPPIMNPQLYWAITYGLIGLTALAFLIKQCSYRNYECERITGKAITLLLGWIVQTSNASNLLFFLAQISLKFYDITKLESITNISNGMLIAAAIIGLPLAAYIAPINDLEIPKTFHRLNGNIYSSTSLRDTPPQHSTTILKCLKELIKTILAIALYIASLMAGTFQLQDLLSYPYPAITKIPDIHLIRNGTTILLGLWGALQAILVAPKRKDSSLHPWIYNIGKFINKLCKTLTAAANCAYALTFIYGVMPLITGIPIHDNIQNLPGVHILTGALIVLALTHARTITHMRRKLELLGVEEQTSAVDTAAISGILSPTPAPALHPSATTPLLTHATRGRAQTSGPTSDSRSAPKPRSETAPAPDTDAALLRLVGYPAPASAPTPAQQYDTN